MKSREFKNKKILIENYLTESMIMCIYNNGNDVQERRLRSGEQLALEEGSVLHMVKDNSIEGPVKCKQTHYHFPWILFIGNKKDMDDNLSYSFEINPKNNNTHHHTDYKITLSWYHILNMFY